MGATLRTTNELVEDELQRRIAVVEDVLDADVIAYMGDIVPMAPMLFKMVLERDGSKRRDRLAVLLETHGGYVEEAERIVNILRHHYATVDFIVSSFAMSAGTVLVMSGDDIYMDYSAALGPIDPQVGRQDNPMPVPALGYLEQYDRLIERSAKGVLTSAELAYLIQKFDPAELYQYEQARELSTALLEE